jgi:hypothetical protein
VKALRLNARSKCARVHHCAPQRWLRAAS